MRTSLLQAFIETRRQPLSDCFETAAQLDALAHAVPSFCVKALGNAQTHVSQKAQLLASLSRGTVERRDIIDQLHQLADNELLQVLDGLRVRRLTGRRVRQLGLHALVGYAQFAELAANHRSRSVRILKHLLGEKTWSSAKRALATPSPDGDRFLQQKLLRFASDVSVARETLCFLAGLGFDQPQPQRMPWLIVPWLEPPARVPQTFTNAALRQSVAARRDLTAGEGMPRETLSGIRGTYHRGVTRRMLRQLGSTPVRRAQMNGPVTAAIKEALVSSEPVSLDDLIAHTVETDVPCVDTRAAVVLDLSGSSVSSGERLYHPAALGLALVGLLQKYVRQLNVFQVGGSVLLNGHGIPRPQGVTDLATAVLEAARAGSESIVIVTDGYENFRQGDVAQVVAGIRRLGLTTAIEQVTPVIAMAENLTQRQLCSTVPVVPIEHEAGVGELVARLLLATQENELQNDRVPLIEQLLFAA